MRGIDAIFWGAIVLLFMVCVAIVMTKDNWLATIGLVCTTILGTYFLGEYDA
jgi:hypothetical protein